LWAFVSTCLTIDYSVLFYFDFCGNFNYSDAYFVDGNNCEVSMGMIGLVLVCTLCWGFGVSDLPNSFCGVSTLLFKGFHCVMAGGRLT
jgi:hypothetical protein